MRQISKGILRKSRAEAIAVITRKLYDVVAAQVRREQKAAVQG